MATCVNGHENPDGQVFCGQCGIPLGVRDPSIGAQPARRQESSPAARYFLIVLLILLGVGAGVMFVAALVGADDANTRGGFANYAAVSGFSAAPWGIGFVLSWFGAAVLYTKR